MASARPRARRAIHRGYVPGLLSIVVPCYNVEDYIGECLASLRFQDYRDIEIVVVDDGSPDASADVARAQQRRDLRVRVVRRPNGGLSAARNTGIEHARGEFLTFVDSDDVVAPDAYGRVVRTLQSTGSDFAVSLYDRLEIDKHRRAGWWIRAAHEERRLRTNIDEFPEIMVNAVAWSKVYRRTFWDRAGLRFPEGTLYEDQPVSSAAYAAATAIDVLPEITVSWRIRHDRSSISQQASTVRNLSEHNEVVKASLGELAARGRARAREIRAAQLLAHNMGIFTRHLLTTDEDYWGVLQDAIRPLVELVPSDDYVRNVAARHKVLQHLILAGRRQDALAFMERFGNDPQRFPATHTSDGVLLDLPFSDDVPQRCSLLAEWELGLFARVLRTSWQDGSLVISGWAHIRHLDLATLPPTVEVSLQGHGGASIPLTTTTHSEVRADEQSRNWHADYRPGGFTSLLAAQDLPREPGSWTVRLRFTAGDVVRETDLDDVSVAGSASVPRTHLDEEGRRYVLRHSESGSLELAVDRPQAHRGRARLDGDQLTVTFTAERADQVELVPCSRPGRSLQTAPATVADAGRWRAVLSLAGLSVTDSPSESPDPAGSVRVQVRSGGRPVDLVGDPVVPQLPGQRAESDAWVVARDHEGVLVLTPARPVATAVEVQQETLVVRCRGVVASAETAPVLGTSRLSVVGSVSAGGDGLVELRVPLSHSEWGRDGLGLPTGKYALEVRHGRDSSPVLVSPELLDTLPVELPSERHHLLVEVFPRGGPRLAVTVREPLAPEERGTRNQHRLRVQCRVEHADMDSVLFRALYGEAANCNMLGVHQELVRRGSGLRLLWSVMDRSVPCPPGGEALVEGSRDWHEAIARSRYQMVNVHQLDWFTKPEGQVIIQTMHGYPYKVMGHEWWDKGGFSGAQIRNYHRRAREWDYFVSPASYATPLLRKAFLEPADAHPEVLEIGYPRNDVLRGEAAEELRRRTRELLGVRPDQTVVLYAPTFRDYLSADDMAAAPVDFFDAEAAARALGDDFVILMRGHAFNARAKASLARGAAVIDVTTHPDVNELICASDVAVLDYSSIRFDYAITGKPMIFLVPDLERYHAARGGVIPFAPTAPGPHVDSTRQVVQHLRHLPALKRDYEAARRQFVADYVDLDDGHASARLVDAVFVPRGDAPPA